MRGEKEAPSSKIQAPDKLQTSSTNHAVKFRLQKPAVGVCRLEFGVWFLSGFWILDLLPACAVADPATPAAFSGNHLFVTSNSLNSGTAFREAKRSSFSIE